MLKNFVFELSFAGFSFLDLVKRMHLLLIWRRFTGISLRAKRGESSSCKFSAQYRDDFGKLRDNAEEFEHYIKPWEYEYSISDFSESDWKMTPLRDEIYTSSEHGDPEDQDMQEETHPGTENCPIEID